MYIYIFLAFLVVMNILFSIKRIRLEFVSQIYSFSLIIGMVVLSEDKTKLVGGLLTIILCVGSAISLSFLENRKNRELSKEKIFLIPLTFIVILEELFFRMVTYENINSPFLFVFFSGTIFGFCHIYFSRKDVIYKLLLGLMLAILYVRSTDIYFCILVHLVYNMFTLNFKRRLKS